MKISHCFIPSKHNKFHPAALRTTGLIIFLAIFLAIPLSYNIITSKQFKVLGYATNININDLYTLSNQERAKAGLPILTLNAELNNAALAKANNMMTDDYWAHVAPDGTTPWDYINGSGYQYTAAGENLAKDFSTSSGVVAGWMGSQTHKDNVLNVAYQDVGYAVVNGVLKGSETTLVVAMYGAKAQTPTTTTDNVVEEAGSQPTATVSTTKTDTDNTSATATDTATTKATNSHGDVEGTSTLLPIKVYNSLNWGQRVSILLLCTLILLFAMKHTAVWREQKRGLKHIWLRSHPLGQIVLLIAVLVAIILSGAGTIL